MLEDRHYMRETPFDSRRTVTVTLVIINVVAFFLQLALARFTNFPFERYFALSSWGLKHGYVWELVSYQFMHGGLLHLVVNCWVVYMFGLAVEEALGRGRFLTLYLASGIIGGLLQTLGGLLLGELLGGRVVGASAAAFGLVAAYAILFPDNVIMLFFIIPMRARYLLPLGAALALFGILAPPDHTPGAVHVADAAHLGGLLTGFVFARYAVHWNWRWPQFRSYRRQSSHRLVKVVSGGGGVWNRSKTIPDEDLPPEEFVSREVDPILDKINAQGIHSLTDRERRILEAARKKMARR
jgi:membrane associated rhomboid family serine protease